MGFTYICWGVLDYRGVTLCINETGLGKPKRNTITSTKAFLKITVKGLVFAFSIA